MSKGHLNQDIIITIGIPLSGKSTLSKFLSEEMGYVVVCPDTVRLAIHGNQYIQSAEPHVWATVDTMVRTLLMQGDKVIIDATNTHESARSKWIKLAKEFNKTIAAAILDTSTELCIQRNATINRLDPSIIERMVGQYVQPSKEEGFDFIFTAMSNVLYCYKFDEVVSIQ